MQMKIIHHTTDLFTGRFVEIVTLWAPDMFGVPDLFRSFFEIPRNNGGNRPNFVFRLAPTATVVIRAACVIVN